MMSAVCLRRATRGLASFLGGCGSSGDGMRGGACARDLEGDEPDFCFDDLPREGDNLVIARVFMDFKDRVHFTYRPGEVLSAKHAIYLTDRTCPGYDFSI
jgi:hypothetical protein